MKEPCILTIEESKDTALFYKNIFNRLNIKNVFTTNNYLEIKPTIKKVSPSIIIADLSGSNESKALNILDIIESSKSKAPIIVVTSSFSFDIKRKLKSFQKTDSFIKPVDIIEFARSINNLLRSMEII